MQPEQWRTTRIATTNVKIKRRERAVTYILMRNKKRNITFYGEIEGKFKPNN